MKAMITVWVALDVLAGDDVLIRSTGEESRCCWKWIEWHSDRSWHAAKTHASRPLCKESNMALTYICPGGD